MHRIKFKEELEVHLFLLLAILAPSHQYHVTRRTSREDMYDVIVVGMGASGLAALSRLHQAGLRVLGLEAEDHIGGRIMTQRYGNGVVEFGAEWIHGHNTVHELAKQARVPLGHTDLGDFRYLSANGSELICDEKCEEAIYYMYTALESVSRETDITIEDYINEMYEKYISNSTELTDHRCFLDALLRWYKYLGHTEDGSGDWRLLSSKGWTDMHRVDGPQNLYWASQNGFQGLFDVLLNRTSCHQDSRPVDIRLNKEVVLVNWAPEGPTDPASVKCADGSEYRASTVLITVSLGVLQARYKTMFTPPLPTFKVESINSLDVGTALKMILRYETNWWNGTTNLGFVWFGEARDMLSEEDEWLEKVLGATIPAGSDNVLTLWLMGQTARFAETLPLEILKMKLDWLVAQFCKPHFAGFRDSVELRRSTWISNPHFLGSYSYHGLRSDTVDDPTEALREPVAHFGAARLLFGGEATSRHHYSTVHGAVESGWREAERILAEECL